MKFVYLYTLIIANSDVTARISESVQQMNNFFMFSTIFFSLFSFFCRTVRMVSFFFIRLHTFLFWALKRFYKKLSDYYFLFTVFITAAICAKKYEIVRRNSLFEEKNKNKKAFALGWLKWKYFDITLVVH